MNEPEAWTEVRVDVPLGWQELVAEALRIAPDLTARFGPDDQDTEPVPAEHERVRIFLSGRRDTGEARAAILQRLRSTGIEELEGLVPRFITGEGRAWDAVWRASWKPFRIGRMCVVPPWDERELRPSDVPLQLVPGGVFGTGRHATTRACLRLLQDLVQPGDRVLDAGCGSGILGIAAALLGAGEVIGFDIDPNAAPHATDLAGSNAVGERCRFEVSGFDERADTAFSGVVANIYADILIAQAERLSASLAPGGWFLFSGIEARHARKVASAALDAGLSVETRLATGRWRTLAGYAPARSAH